MAFGAACEVKWLSENRLYSFVCWLVHTICRVFCYYWVRKKIMYFICHVNVKSNTHYVRCCVLLRTLTFGRSNKYNLLPVTTTLLHKLTQMDVIWDRVEVRQVRTKPFCALTHTHTHSHSSTIGCCCCCCCQISTIGAWRMTHTQRVVPYAVVRRSAINIKRGVVNVVVAVAGRRCMCVCRYVCAYCVRYINDVDIKLD